MEGKIPSTGPGEARRASLAAFRNAATDTHLLDYLAGAYRHRYIAGGVLVVVILLALVHVYTTTPLYRAQARIIVEVEDDQVSSLTGVLSGENYRDPAPYYQTQFRILTGRELARRTARSLDLATVPEFNGTGATRTQLAQTLDAVKARIGLGSEPSSHDGSVPEAALVANFQSRVSVEPIKNSRLVDITFVSANPEFAARAANQLAREYVDQNADQRRRNVTSGLSWIEQELDRQKAKVEASERALASYREKQNALSLEDRQNIVVARLNQLNDAATKAKTSLVQKESLYNQVRTLSPESSPDTIPAILQNQYIQSIKNQLAELERDKANLSERYGERHPEIIKVNASIKDASRRLEQELAKAIDAIRNDYQAALAEERSLTGSLEEQKGAAMSLGRKSVSYTVLEREAQSNRQVYETLLSRQKELEVLGSSRGNNVRLVEDAEVPGGPFTPNLRRTLLLASLAGLSLAVGLVVGLTYFDDTIKTPEDITAKLKAPFLGMIPKVQAGVAQPGTSLVLTSRTTHEFGEAYRSLRTALAFSHSNEGGKVVLVTSSQPLEGKTTTACNIAIALALGGERVLLIDADLRRPNVAKTLGIETGAGLSNLLTAQTSPKDAVRTTDTENLWVMTSGPVPPNPSELLASDRMRMVLDAENSWFDWIVVDAPPVLAVTDAVLMAPMASGVAFVVRSEMTPQRHVKRALETLMTGQPRLLGLVLNGVDLERNKYYYSRYYGYEHTHYYSTSTAS
jgi:capsular exopolysaccharide synthesis family protein